jgi:hypothetical protein
MSEVENKMEKLKFITAHGVCGFTYEWDARDASVRWDAAGWLEAFGTRVGSGTAPLPDQKGCSDLSQFAIVQSE